MSAQRIKVKLRKKIFNQVLGKHSKFLVIGYLLLPENPILKNGDREASLPDTQFAWGNPKNQLFVKLHLGWCNRFVDSCLWFLCLLLSLQLHHFHLLMMIIFYFLQCPNYQKQVSLSLSSTPSIHVQIQWSLSTFRQTKIKWCYHTWIPPQGSQSKIEVVYNFLRVPQNRR